MCSPDSSSGTDFEVGFRRNVEIAGNVEIAVTATSANCDDVSQHTPVGCLLDVVLPVPASSSKSTHDSGGKQFPVYTQLTKKRWQNVVTTLYSGCENVQESFIGEFSQRLLNIIVQRCQKTCYNLLRALLKPLQLLNVRPVGSHK